MATVVINNVIFETITDGYGVERFRMNRIIRDLVDAAMIGMKLDLHEIAVRCANNRYTTDDQRELYRLIGYSICGYVDIFPDDTVEYHAK